MDNRDPIEAHQSTLDTPLTNVWPVDDQYFIGDYEQMLQRGEIRILTPFTLGWYFINSGQPTGIIYEVSQLFEQYLHRTAGVAGKHLKVTVIPVRRDQLIEHLRQGHGDLLFANLTVTAARAALIDFSEPVIKDVKEVWVSGPAQPPPVLWTDIGGMSVVVRRESSYYDSLILFNQGLIALGYPPVQIELADPHLEDEELLQMVAAGQYPATVVDEHITWPWQRALPSLQISNEVILRHGAHTAYGMRKQSPQLKAVVNQFIKQYPQGSTTMNVVINRYLKRDQWVSPATDLNLFRKAEAMIPIFQRYAERYGFDWVLLMAFAYQESQFSQQARSHSGAIGVMQVMPATANDSAVNVGNVTQLENNIHAGTKYLAVLRDRYFNDPVLSSFERTLFTMAGYNAGPNRINRLREQTLKRGLDPNRWFNNVEDVVAADVGLEPIKYVANIYRFYISYKQLLLTASERQRLRQQQIPWLPAELSSPEVAP